MALHTGTAERRAKDYFGPALNRVARLMATAHGGQVVASLATAELGRDALPAGATLIDLGEHRLADLARPEHVFQLVHPDLPADFPALRSLDAHRHNLPISPTPFVGREHELEEIDALLAGTRLVTLPHEVAARLDYAFRLLTAGARTLDRHRTLRATVDWGYDLLSEPERTVLCRLSVFAGGFDLEAAEAVVPDGTEITGGDVLDLLGRLVDRSWVGIEPGARGTRYRLLETIRQYAAEKLADSSDGDAVRRRHTDHFVGVATFLPDHPLRPPSWLARVDADQDNLGAALERSFQGGDIEACLRMTAGLSRFWGLSGRVIEGRAWLERVLEAAPAEGTVGTVGALNGMGFLLFQAGEPPALAAGFHERARAVAQAIGDRSGDSVVLTLARGDEDSYDSFTHALAALAPLTAVLGDGTRARGFADEAIEAARSLHLPHVLVMALTRAAETAVRLGDMARAAQHLAESLSLLKEMEGLAWVACSLELSALIAVARARHREAARLIGAAHALDEISAESSKARPLHDEVERCMAELGPVLGPEQLEAELAAGAAMPVKEVLTLALQELAPDA